jgi:hypothetical protein
MEWIGQSASTTISQFAALLHICTFNNTWWSDEGVGDGSRGV